MNPPQHIAAALAAGNPAVPLLLTAGDVNAMNQNPEQAMEDIRLRATQMSQILEDILHEPHGEPRWGLNE